MAFNLVHWVLIFYPTAQYKLLASYYYHIKQILQTMLAVMVMTLNDLTYYQTHRPTTR